MKRDEKNEIIEILDKMITNNSNFCLADVSGLTAEESSNLRRLCFKREVSLQVVKNTLLKKAFDKNDTDFEPMYDVLNGNTSIMFSNTNNGFAKVIKEFRKKHDKPILKAAHIESEFYIGDQHLGALTELKSKDELIAEIILLLQSPTKNVISALKSGSSKLSGILSALENNNGLDNSQEETKEEETKEK